MTLSECTRDNSCYHCDDKECKRVGDIGADCPRYICPRPEPSTGDCESCAFIKKYIKDVYGEDVEE